MSMNKKVKVKTADMTALTDSRNTLATTLKRTGEDLRNACKGYVTAMFAFLVASGCSAADVFKFNGNAKKFEGAMKVINDERMRVKDALIGAGLDKDSANTYWSRDIMPELRKVANPKEAAKLEKKKQSKKARAVKKADKKPGKVTQVNKANIKTLSVPMMVGFLQARISAEQEVKEPAYKVTDVIKGLKLAVTGYNSKVISK